MHLLIIHKAFPSSNTPETGYYAEGMSLRDYFAGQALISITLSSGINKTYALYIKNTGEEPNQWTAVTAYKLADAMLKERERKE